VLIQCLREDHQNQLSCDAAEVMMREVNGGPGAQMCQVTPVQQPHQSQVDELMATPPMQAVEPAEVTGQLGNVGRLKGPTHSRVSSLPMLSPLWLKPSKYWLPETMGLLLVHVTRTQLM
jgi:hypothetical protein